MGFKYVLIPATPNEPMQELEFHSDIVDLAKDTFREMCEQYFARLGGEADRSVLLEQLQARTGVDLKDKAAKGEMDQKALDQLLSTTSVEIFPVMLPTKENGFDAISMYCDDKGVAKGLEENARATGLARAAGFPQQTFRGDIFVGRVFDDTEDEWRRVDFPLSLCNSDAEWVTKCKKQRERRSSCDIKSLADQIGANNPAKVTPDTMQDATPTGETDAYKWRQTDDEVEVTFKTEGLQKGDKKLVKVAFTRAHLKVEVRGQAVIDTPLFAAVTADECTWTLSDGVLQVTLAKAEELTWSQLTK